METITSAENKGFSYIVFFDLDRTLTKAISGRAIARRAFRKGYMRRSDLVSAAFIGLAYRAGLLHPVTAMRRMLEWVNGLDEKVLSKLGREVASEVMLPSIYSDVPAEIEVHKANKARTVILSATLEPVCREVALFLHIDDIICSRLEVIDGYLTGRPEGNLCYGDEKVMRIKEYCERNNNKTEDAWYYGDSVADIPVLEAVGHPVCINPDKKLRKVAEKNNWKIYFWD